ncbi:MAG: hypothetical protein QM704_26605 [Anaeromyxobacteraceae bacterium]
MTHPSAALRLAALTSLLALAACGDAPADPSVVRVADDVLVPGGCPDGRDLLVTFEDVDGETVVRGRCIGKLAQHIPGDPSHDLPSPMRPEAPDGPGPGRLPAADR